MNAAAMCNAPAYEKDEKLEESMTEDRLAAEKRGFDYLSKLVKRLRLDADEVADKIRTGI